MLYYANSQLHILSNCADVIKILNSYSYNTRIAQLPHFKHAKTFTRFLDIQSRQYFRVDKETV